MELPLAQYSTEPIYNMRAVSQRTGIPAPTLRAWERRHKALSPERSGGNYRLYSERDVAVLLWLDQQIKAGLTISRAVALLERLTSDAARGPAASPLPAPDQAESLPRLSAALRDGLLRMDERSAGDALAEAFALYPIPDVCESVIAPALVQIGEAWHRGTIGVATEHFATSYTLGRLLALLAAQPLGAGRMVLVGCAPGERHEIGALMLALMLRREGQNVRYLGGDVPVSEWARAIREHQPGVVAVSAHSAHTAEALDDLAPLLADLPPARLPHVVVGGAAFRAGTPPPGGLQAEVAQGGLRTSAARICQLLGE